MHTIAAKSVVIEIPAASKRKVKMFTLPLEEKTEENGYSLVSTLPGYSVHGTDDIKTLYIQERKAITTEEELKVHLQRWSNLWLLDARSSRPNRPGMIKLAEKIAAGDIRFDIAMQCLKDLRVTPDNPTAKCKHVGQMTKSCVGMMIVLPPALLIASLKAKEFGVPFSVALHQMYCDGPHHHCF